MLVERPTMLCLGGEEAFEAYRKEFARLYRSGTVFDVLGRRVFFPVNAAQHVCFKTREEDPYRRLKREVWAQERAERIPWILTALQHPDEIRPDHKEPGRHACLLTIVSAPTEGLPQEYYGVFVSVEGLGLVTFLTAFPMDGPYWRDARRSGPRLYPPPQPKKPKKR